MITADDFRREARQAGVVDRRLFMAYVASLAAAPAVRSFAATNATASLAANPFALGVASGDPTAHGVLLWTRLAPRPLEPGGGMDPLPIEVRWEVAKDEHFGQVVAKGETTATPHLGHSVHVPVDGLDPDRWYFYRFITSSAESPIGRTRTMPLKTAQAAPFRLAFASCQHYETGHYAAYRHMAGQDLDLVVHLGDYIYEGAAKEGGVRKHVGGELQSLDDYRIRHALYRSDPALHGMHALCPWMVTWDDHEFDNNYADKISEERDVDPVEFLLRRANSYQAYYEAMPLRRRSLPQGPHMRLYRKLIIGSLAEMYVLDTRQYRDDQPQGDGKHDLDKQCRSPRQSLLGGEQRDWLEGSLIASGAKWNILAQQVMMGTVDHKKGPKRRFSMDQWPGYLYERNRLMAFLQERRIANPIVLTGDIHSNWVNNLRVDDFDEQAPVVATEFVGTSISSSGNEPDATAEADSLLRENPGVRFFNRRRGYVACEIDATQWQSRYFAVEDVTKPDSAVAELASFTVDAGRPGAAEAS